MNAHGTDRTAPSIKQLKDFLGFVVAIITEIATEFFFRLSADEAKALLQNKATIGKNLKIALSGVFVLDADPYAEQRTYWEAFYERCFEIGADFSAVVIPKKPKDGKWRLIFIRKGLKMNWVVRVFRELLVAYDPEWELWTHVDDLDKAIIRNMRTSAESYAIWVRDGQESDEEFRGQSIREADPDQWIGVTLLERLIHGMVHFVETKQHLDYKGFTLCSGSRDSGGSVPFMCWNPDYRKMNVNRIDLNHPCQPGGVRRAVAA
jgi:hypothetical protein